MMVIKTIADIRAVNYWDWVTNPIDPFDAYWGVVHHEIQIKDPSGTWTPIEVIDINKDGKNET
jgi:hypothetical protein